MRGKEGSGKILCLHMGHGCNAKSIINVHVHVHCTCIYTCTYTCTCMYIYMYMYLQVFSLSAWTGTPVGSGCGQTGIGCGLVGMVVGEVQELEQLEGEGGVALERSEVNTKAMYIISLG